MSKFNFLIFFLFITFCIPGCRDNKESINTDLVPQAARENFLNNFQKAIADSLLKTCNLITFSRYNYHFLDKYHNQITRLYPSFSSDDNEFIIAQMNNYEDDEHKNREMPVRLKKLKIISERELKANGTNYTAFWESFHKRLGSVPYIECSKPLFSKSLNYAVMEIDVKAKPATGFAKGVYVFRQVNSNWTYVKKLE